MKTLCLTAVIMAATFCWWFACVVENYQCHQRWGNHALYDTSIGCHLLIEGRRDQAAMNGAKCAICYTTGIYRRFRLPLVLKDLTIKCEELNIPKPSGTSAHPSCVNRLKKRIERKEKRT